MREYSETFNVSLTNIPHINLRNEFARYYQALHDSRFTDQFRGEIKPIHTPYMVWHGMPDDLVTIILQRAILGLESFLPNAVYLELGKVGRLKENIEKIRNPFSLKGKGTVDNYYNLLPGLISNELSLKLVNPDLFNKTKKFYKEIRNPVFHGCHIADHNINGVRRIYEFLLELYKWIDNWHDYTRPF